MVSANWTFTDLSKKAKEEKDRKDGKNECETEAIVQAPWEGLIGLPLDRYLLNSEIAFQLKTCLIQLIEYNHATFQSKYRTNKN